MGIQLPHMTAVGCACFCSSLSLAALYGVSVVPQAVHRQRWPAHISLLHLAPHTVQCMLLPVLPAICFVWL